MPQRSDSAVSKPRLITIENRSSVLSAEDLFDLAWAVNYQLSFHYNRSQWRHYAPTGHAALLPQDPKTGKPIKPPAGAWNLVLLDNSDQQGALGYHDDANGTNIPYSEVFCKDAIADGATPSSVASHEAIEMLVDPDVSKPRTVAAPDGKQYILEACDAVQGNDYDVGAPEGRETGVLVADFCLPSWWGMDQGARMSFRGAVALPFELAPQGYISVAPKGADTTDPSVWQQIYGAQQERRPKWASRLSRIHPA